MINIPFNELYIESLTERHDLSNFVCQEEDLNEFLKTDAFNDQNILISKTYVCIYKNRVIGFFSLLADTIKVKDLQKRDNINECGYHSYPAIKIGRLAVDEKHERKGVGKYLMLKIFGACYEILNHLGVRFITVDSKEKSLGFYKKMYFTETKKKSDYQKLYFDYYRIVVHLRKPYKKLDDF